MDDGTDDGHRIGWRVSGIFNLPFELAPTSRAALGLALFRALTAGRSIMIALDAHDWKDQDCSRASAIEG
jgi:hypothetical protein